MKTRSIRLILNGKKMNAAGLRQAVDKVRSEGAWIDVDVTWEGRDAARHVAQALKDRVDVIMAAGGDGTVNEVLNGLFRETQSPEVPLAVMPLGSANDFARGSGIAVDDPLDALRLAATGEATPIDVGRVDNHLFLNALVAGFGAEVTFRTGHRMKKLMRGAAYGLTGFLMALKGEHLYKSSGRSDSETWQDDVIIMAALCNGVQAGGVRLAPKARLNDGVLDVITMLDFPTQSLSKAIEEMEHAGEWKGENRYLSFDRIHWIEVEAESAFPLSPDGEEMYRQHFRVDVLQRRLPMILPAGAPLLHD